MLSPLRGLLVVVTCLLAIASLTTISVAQALCPSGTPCVTTWHNDNNRTGLQPNESTLNTTNVQTGFGLLWQWGPLGRIYAQPLAVSGVTTQYQNCAPCDLVFVATETDMLYAFKANSNSQNPVWSRNLATAAGGTAVDCTTSQASSWSLCTASNGNGLVGQYVGVTGTPVIDTSAKILYVVGAVETTSSPNITYNLFAVDITSGTVLGYTPINGTIHGKLPPKCQTSSPAAGDTISFNENHIQRSALLLTPSSGWVYVTFGELPEASETGWMFAYSYSTTTSSFTRQAAMSPTADGTGGGMWQSGAGPATDSQGNIYVAVANGTFDLGGTAPADNDAGDSLLKLDPSSLAILSYYTPYNVLTFDNGTGLCTNDEDLGSGGVLLPPDYSYNGKSVVINADKQSNLYVSDQANLGGFNSSTNCTNSFNNLQCITSPPKGTDSKQGYWASPGYWHYKDQNGADQYMLYYSVTSSDPTVAPKTLNAYQLNTSVSALPIPSQYASTSVKFCPYSPTPSVSSSGTGYSSGIVWAIEHQNRDSTDCAIDQEIMHAALHAFNATTLAELYRSNGVQTNIGGPTPFSTPTIFKGQVYMETKTEVDVFGLCSVNGQSGCLQ